MTGLLFFICAISFFTFGQQGWTNYNKENSGIPINAVHTITFDSSGTKWIGTWGGGLVKFNDTTWTVYDTANSPLPHNNIYSILLDKENNKWIGTFGGGLAKFDDTNWTIYNTSNSGLTDNTIYEMIFDEDENVLISTWGHAFIKFDRLNTWTNYNKREFPFYNNKVSALLYDNNNLWIGGAYGLFVMRDSTIINYADSSSDFKQPVYTFAKGKDGTTWVGFKTSGLACYKHNKWEFITYLNSPLPSNTVYNLNIDNNKSLWVSTFGTGLAKLSGSEWTIYNKTSSPLTDDFIFSTSQDKDGRIWVCTLNGGIFVIPAGN